jgi:hypothetical protein
MKPMVKSALVPIQNGVKQNALLAMLYNFALCD